MSSTTIGEVADTVSQADSIGTDSMERREFLRRSGVAAGTIAAMTAVPGIVTAATSSPSAIVM
ncbi:MAG: twin-arginine translocation signal domain-containing protein [Sphingomonadaceae bacterium]